MKKKLMAVLAIVLVIALSVAGTYAYLTSQAEVKNTFTVGNVKITMDEAKVDVDGVAIADAARVDANAYKLMPGHSYLKDPTIHVDANSEACWLFVKVVNEISTIETTEEGKSVAAQMAANGWTLVADTDNVYAYSTTVKGGNPDADVKVFSGFTIKGDVTNEALEAYADKTIVVTAYAVQADGFDTAEKAWAAADFAA